MGSFQVLSNLPFHDSKNAIFSITFMHAWEWESNGAKRLSFCWNVSDRWTKLKSLEVAGCPINW